MTPELLAIIATQLGLTAEEVQALSLAEVDELLIALFTEQSTPDDGAAPDIVALTAIRDSRRGVLEAITAAEAEAEAAEAELAALAADMAPVTAEAEPVPEAEPEAGPVETPEGEPAPEAEVIAEPVAAGAVTVPTVRMRLRPAAHEPIDTGGGSGVRLTAAGNVMGYSAGQTIPSLRALGQAFADTVGSLTAASGQPSGGTRKHHVAKFSLGDFGAHRTLKAGDDEANAAKIRNVVSPRAIAAAGGNCAPVANRYDFENISVDDRPVRDSLARFNADRGGINVPTSPVITAPDAGVDVITEVEDTANATKPCAVVTCPTYTQIDVAAVYRCIEIGNFSRQFFSELFSDWWAHAGALHARKAEGALLDGIGATATQVSDGQNLGAARDLLGAWIRAAAKERSTHRMARLAPVELLAPSWLPDLMVADLIREAPGDDRLDLNVADIDRFIRSKNITPTWYLDGEAGEGQIYAEQGAGALAGWNLSPVTYMFPTGGYLFLDGGELDFGTEIRDTDTNERNVVRAFLETFENVARVGQWALETTHNLCVSGAASALVDVTCPENS